MSSSPTTQRIVGMLRSGFAVTDLDFDSLLAQADQLPSRRFWTPVDVALLAARWLNDAAVARVLDIGSGVGKFCVIAALASSVEVVGIEHRPRLTKAARDLADKLGVADRVEFVDGRVEEIEIAAFDALYFFNPFGENLHLQDEQLDVSVELGEDRYRADVAFAEQALRRVAVGTRVLTYHGFGGRIPFDYTLERYEQVGSGTLKMWRLGG